MSLLNVKTILVPVDFSEHSKAALEEALAIADHFDASIHVLYVVEKGTFGDFENFPLTLDDSATCGKAREKLVRFIQTGRHKEVPVFPEARVGNPWEEIVATGKREKADLIVISTHGYTGLKHVVLGSTAERVIRHAEIPVLVVRTHQTKN